MVFHTVFFLIAYLPAALLVYHLIPGRLQAARNTVLLILSILFYAWAEPIYVFLLIYVCVCTYLLGRDIEKKLDQERPRAASQSVIFGLALNGFILCFFKYFSAMIGALGSLFHTTLNVKELSIPVGVSFFTLQAIAYLLDIWNEKTRAIKNPVQFGLFLAFFPRLIAGPLVTAQEMESQLVSRKESWATVGAGFSRFITGLAKKVLLADTIGVVWQNIAAFEPAELSMLTAWIGAFAFGFELYFDFSGYADMAIGLGGMFGFTLPENFMYPFTAKSVSEFWRRFNITVFKWFRERIYLPLGGESDSMSVRARSLFLVYALMGFWYGPAWHYLVWGMLLGIVMVLERFVYGHRLQKLPQVLRHVYTILILTVTWAMFGKGSVADGFRYMGVLFGGSRKIIDGAAWYYLRTNILLFIVLVIACLPVGKKLKDQYVRTSHDRSVAVTVGGYVLLFVICLAVIASQSNPMPLMYRF